MSRQLRALDLFCGAGGASMGLHRAGFEVIGVDINPMPRYPFLFLKADAMCALTEELAWFDLVWASPPCQRFSQLATREDLSHYPDLIEPIRAKLIAAGMPYVIENVPGAPIRKDLMLCGSMFGLRSYRHRGFLTITGDVGTYCGPEAMGIDWMSGDEMSEAVPPAYAEYIAREAIRQDVFLEQAA